MNAMTSDTVGMEKVFSRTPTLYKKLFHYCPGCGHSIAHRLVAEVIDELGVAEDTIGVIGVGCSWNGFEYFDLDFVYSLHGRAPAVATGVKRSHPDKVVFTYQGDGDLGAIGTAEIVHAAARSENITTIFINNAVYGMTGGQMAPTTLVHQVTTTSPLGRDPKQAGLPIKVSEMLATLDGARYLERVAVDSTANILRARRAIKRAFEVQLSGVGFSLVEVLSPCPEQWRLPPQQACEWLREHMIKHYPLGKLKDST